MEEAKKKNKPHQGRMPMEKKVKISQWPVGSEQKRRIQAQLSLHGISNNPQKDADNDTGDHNSVSTPCINQCRPIAEDWMEGTPPWTRQLESHFLSTFYISGHRSRGCLLNKWFLNASLPPWWHCALYLVNPDSTFLQLTEVSVGTVHSPPIVKFFLIW